ncbi:MAG: glycosyltransferase [Pirellulaceae bacterium]|nr:glycosyltransferase [Pirellulaceae bacterium]
MDASLVTLAIVPRERFSFAQRSLECILANTLSNVELIYVDGNSPAQVRNSLEATCGDRNARFIDNDTYLSPNVARNLAAAHVRTKYVAFVDNDVLASPGWLEKLVACAEETQAWAVGPLYCQGEPAGTEIHMAGGTAHFYEQEGNRFFREAHTSCGKSVSQVASTLRRQPVELLEFHTLLLRTDTFDRFGPLDEGYLSVHEHVDVCLTLRHAGLGVFMEPNSITTYVGPLPLADYDRDFFALRWCDAWNRLSMQHFRAKWDLCAADPGLQHAIDWACNHRCKVLTTWQTLLRPLGRKRARKLIALYEASHSRKRFQLEACRPGHPFSGGRTHQTHNAVA